MMQSSLCADSGLTTGWRAPSPPLSPPPTVQDAAEKGALYAANVALRKENGTLVAQLREVGVQQAQLAAQQRTAAAAAARTDCSSRVAAEQEHEAGTDGIAGADEAAAEAAALREENEALRRQLEMVVAQNAELQGRLMDLAFMPPVEHYAEGATRPLHMPCMSCQALHAGVWCSCWVGTSWQTAPGGCVNRLRLMGR